MLDGLDVHTVAAETATRRLMVPADLWAMERVGDPALSPDGRWVAYTVRETNWDDNAYETEIWLAGVDPVVRKTFDRVPCPTTSR